MCLIQTARKFDTKMVESSKSEFGYGHGNSKSDCRSDCNRIESITPDVPTT